MKTGIKEWFKNELKEMKEVVAKVPALLMTLFVLSIIGMNLLANKSLNLNLSWLALDAGIILSWLAFLTMDIVVNSYGPKVANRLTIIGIVLNLFMAAIFAIGASISGQWGESFISAGGEIANTALDNTFRGTWFVLLGSTIAFMVSALVNNTLNWTIGKAIKKDTHTFKTFAARAYISTTVGQFVDNFIFGLIVSMTFFGWSFLQVFMCALTGAVVELIFEIAFSPFGYKLSNKLRLQEEAELIELTVPPVEEDKNNEPQELDTEE